MIGGLEVSQKLGFFLEKTRNAIKELNSSTDSNISITSMPTFFQFLTENGDEYYFDISSIMDEESRKNLKKEIALINKSDKIISVYCMMLYSDISLRDIRIELKDFIEKDPERASALIEEEFHNIEKSSSSTNEKMFFCMFDTVSNIKKNKAIEDKSIILLRVDAGDEDSILNYKSTIGRGRVIDDLIASVIDIFSNE